LPDFGRGAGLFADIIARARLFLAGMLTVLFVLVMRGIE
jgi:hypothetical protein